MLSRSFRIVGFLFIVLLGAAGEPAQAQTAGACEQTEECPVGHACVLGSCRLLCTAPTSCGALTTTPICIPFEGTSTCWTCGSYDCEVYGEGYTCTGFGSCQAPPLIECSIHEQCGLNERCFGFKCVSMTCPLIVHLTEKGLGWYHDTFTDVDDGAPCDLDRDGDADRCSWVRPEASVAFLARFDSEEWALLHGGGSLLASNDFLFGDTSDQAVGTSEPTGFTALSFECGEHIDTSGAVDLQACGVVLWHDFDKNGYVEIAELLIPSDYGWNEIPTRNIQEVGLTDHLGNLGRYKTMLKGRAVVDVYFTVDDD